MDAETRLLLKQTANILQFQNDLLLKGLIFDKKVSKVNNYSGAVFVPKRFVGQRFRVILIPLKDEDHGLYADPDYDNPVDGSKARGTVKELYPESKTEPVKSDPLVKANDAVVKAAAEVRRNLLEVKDVSQDSL